jgi:hypothetical protein
VRIWDLGPETLCRNHLLGEHRELHAIWSILTEGRKGYARHPETLRWKGKLRALYGRHEALVREMRGRGYKHKTSLSSGLATGKAEQDEFVDSLTDQVRILKNKQCGCKIGMASRLSSTGKLCERSILECDDPKSNPQPLKTTREAGCR